MSVWLASFKYAKLAQKVVCVNQLVSDELFVDVRGRLPHHLGRRVSRQVPVKVPLTFVNVDDVRVIDGLLDDAKVRRQRDVCTRRLVAAARRL